MTRAMSAYRPPEPVPDQVQVIGVIADRAVGQPRRGPRQHESGQHVGLEASEFPLDFTTQTIIHHLG
jgi:hypothetical protein